MARTGVGGWARVGQQDPWRVVSREDVVQCIDIVLSGGPLHHVYFGIPGERVDDHQDVSATWFGTPVIRCHPGERQVGRLCGLKRIPVRYQSGGAAGEAGARPAASTMAPIPGNHNRLRRSILAASAAAPT